MTRSPSWQAIKYSIIFASKGRTDINAYSLAGKKNVIRQLAVILGDEDYYSSDAESEGEGSKGEGSDSESEGSDSKGSDFEGSDSEGESSEAGGD